VKEKSNQNLVPIFGTTDTKVPKTREVKLIGGNKSALKNIQAPEKKENLDDKLHQGFPRFRNTFPHEAIDQQEKDIKEEINKENLIKKKRDMEKLLKEKKDDKNKDKNKFLKNMKQKDELECDDEQKPKQNNKLKKIVTKTKKLESPLSLLQRTIEGKINSPEDLVKLLDENNNEGKFSL